MLHRWGGVEADPKVCGCPTTAERILESRAVYAEGIQEPSPFLSLERTDSLEIDGHFTYVELTSALEAAAPMVRQSIAIHNISWFAERNGIEGDDSAYPSHISREKKGLKPAIYDFLDHFPEWVFDREEEGIVFLKRVAGGELEEKIDFALKNKLILCTGPSFGNRDLLIKMTERDMEKVSFKKIFLTTADTRNLDVVFKGQKPICEFMDQRGKMLDCLNCFISTYRNVANDPECLDDDIAIFKHESIYINDMNLFRKAIGKIIQGKNLVIRVFEGRDYSLPVYVPDPCIMKVSAIRELFKKKPHPYLDDFTEEYISPEYYLTFAMLDSVADVHRIPFYHCFHKDTQLGFYHIPSVEYVEFGYWDKKDYYEIYR